ncbi:FAD-dependent oxidoreductase [Candidatus Bathycorpusculum sp.]|jgi:NADH oxidase (H2O2-forming)|uniref:FAD-dependent oxidoreductase n=1 Tax=Candidatus Bathycorpusculum sp. TaxID=2994959 RepID=UPI00281E3E7B|nr:FAD-dependent oxidoreductase [Candidatus Termitimicrobium sp.]MCL2685217.1 FAD-dependent oxidoreductase [Candidatus Termitimicrobium sp.]
MVRQIVIIGASAAGIEAAAAARKKDRTAEIILITQEKTAGYSRCGLPFVIAGHIPNFRDLVVYPPAFFQMQKLDLRTQTKVSAINTKDKTLTIQTKENSTQSLPYDTLVIATGAEPFMPSIKGKEKAGIHSLRTLEDGEKIDAAIKAGAQSALIMGAGLIGLELSAGLVERGLKVTVVEMLPQILPQFLDADMAKLIQQHLEEKGITILLNTIVEEFLGETQISAVKANGQVLEADLIISAFGVRASTNLAKEANIPLGETQAIKTNARMETEIKDVYAVGDCAEAPSLITHRPTCAQLGTIAVREGKVAGTNAGGDYSLFNGVLASAVTQLFDIQVANTGLTQTAAQRNRIEVITATVSSKTRASYFPGTKPIKIKLVVEKESKRIIGAQIVGGEEVTQRINSLSFAIQQGMTIQELAKADTAYAPPLCETWEPMILAAEMILMKLR